MENITYIYSIDSSHQTLGVQNLLHANVMMFFSNFPCRFLEALRTSNVQNLNLKGNKIFSLPGYKEKVGLGSIVS